MTVPVVSFLERANAAAAGAPAQKISACSLLTREEVKSLSPWPPLLDPLETQEDSLQNGTACTYPNVHIQVLSMSQDQWKRWINSFKNPSLEAVSGVGDEAYLRDNRQMWAELCAKVGPQVLTIQMDLKDGES